MQLSTLSLYGVYTLCQINSLKSQECISSCLTQHTYTTRHITPPPFVKALLYRYSWHFLCPINIGSFIIQGTAPCNLKTFPALFMLPATTPMTWNNINYIATSCMRVLCTCQHEWKSHIQLYSYDFYTTIPSSYCYHISHYMAHSRLL